MKLTLCMIVRNEERDLPACIESVKSVVDEIIICDTGSDDNTVTEAEKFDARILRFEWNGDFSAARNYSISKANGHWILWLDADERLNSHSINELRKITAAKSDIPTAYRINIRNSQDKGRYFYLSSAHRLFSNHHGIKFSGKIHEQVSPSISALKGRELTSNITVDHFGYDLSKEDMQAKYERNLHLLLKEADEDPHSAYTHFNLGKQYALLKQYEKSLRHFSQALNNDKMDHPMRCSTYNAMSESQYYLKNYSDAEKYARKSLKLIPRQTAAHFMLYSLAKQRAAWKDAEKALDQLQTSAEKVRKHGSGLSNDVMLNKVYFLEQKAFLAYQNKDWDKFIRTLQEVDHDKLDPDILKLLLSSYLKLSRNADALDLLSDMIRDNSDKDTYDLYAKLLINQKRFAEAIDIYQKIIRKFSAQTEDIRMLAGLYAKQGQNDKAVALLQSLQQI